MVSLAIPILRGSECPNKQHTKQNEQKQCRPKDILYGRKRKMVVQVAASDPQQRMRTWLHYRGRTEIVIQHHVIVPAM